MGTPTLPITIVRPSIIESALAEPRPGWIRGFRMAEPIIVSYGRGLLREFPGVPEGVVDVIPVDMVVAAIIAVAAAGPDPAGPTVYHVASSVRNPLRYGQLVDLVRSWFTDHPLYDSDGQPIMVPQWSFPGRGRVQRQLQRATKALTTAERVLGALPVRGERADLAARVEERRTQAERALGYTELYGAYTETEAHFRVDRLLSLWERLSPEDKAAFCFDPGVISWPGYVHDVHLPSVVEHARVRSSPRRSTVASRSDRARTAILSPDRHLAAFDLENTLVASNVVESYAWLASRHLPVGERVAFTARILREAPRCSPSTGATGATSCAASTGATRAPPPSCCATTPSTCSITSCWPSRSRPASPGCAPTGPSGTAPSSSPAPSTSSSSPCDRCSTRWCAPSSARTRGRYTGRLEHLPPTGEARALVLAEYAAREGLDLGESVAYADSASDLPLLECVGFPVAVNPEARLATIARRRGWHVEQWDKAGGGARPPLPFGPVDHSVSRWWARLEACSSAVGGTDARARARDGHGGLGDEGARLRAQPGALRGVTGGIGVRGIGPRRGRRPAAPDRRGTTRAARPAMAPRPSAPGRHLRVGPVHRRRAQLALLRRHRELPLRPRPRGGGHPRRHRYPRRDRARPRAAWRAASSRPARRAPRAAREAASASPSGTWPRDSRSGSAPTPAVGGRRAVSWPTTPSSTRCPTRSRTTTR